MGDMNFFDIIIGSIIVILSVKGFFRGFIKEVLGLLGLIAGVFIGSRFAPSVGEFIDTNIMGVENKALLSLFAFFAILTVIWIGSISIGTMLSKLTKASGLGFLNNLLGMIAGGGKYFIVFALIAAAISNIEIVKDKIATPIKDSILFPVLVSTGSYLINLDYKEIQKKAPVPIDIDITTKSNQPSEVNATSETNTTKVAQ